MERYVKIFMSIVTIFVAIYHFLRFTKEVKILRKIHIKSNVIHDDKLNTVVKNSKFLIAYYFISFLCMLAFSILYIINMPLEILANLLLVFSCVVSVISGMKSKIILSRKELNELLEILENDSSCDS